MSFIDLPMDLDDLDKPVAEDTYELIISDVQEKTDDDGNLKGLLVILEIVGEPDAANVLHNVSIPLASDDEDKAKNKLRFMKRFFNTFGITTPGGRIDITSMLGKRAFCHLVLDEYNGIVSNKIKFGK
jgi:hypothetical protein